MSFTVVNDQDQIDRRFENAVNRFFRHCRVVNVRPKAKLFKYEDIMRPDPVLPMSPSWGWVHTGGFVPVGSSADVPLVPAHGVML